MKLLVGLGNVGKQYQSTRHNIGFMVIDRLAQELGSGDFRTHSKARAEVLDLKSNHDCILVKPATMMNLSGEAVGQLMRFYKVGIADVWIVYDDVDLTFGQLRIRLGGGSAGHNGVKSLIAHLGDGFWRLRLGVANDHLAETPTDRFVLDSFSKDESDQLSKITDGTAKLLIQGLEANHLTDQTLSF